MTNLPARRYRGGTDLTPVSQAVGINLVPVAGIWVVEFLDMFVGGRLDLLGVRAWDFPMMWTILTAPMLHLGWPHVISNTVPLLVLGVLTALGGIGRWLVVVGFSAVFSGLFAFFINPPGTLTVGASGIVFGLLSYLLFRAIYSRDGWQLILAVVVFGLYGSVLWGVLPIQAGVSWQGHLGGGVGGIVAAWWLYGRSGSSSKPSRSRPSSVNRYRR